MRPWIAGALGSILVWGIALAQQPLPMGEEFQVNTYTTNYQRHSNIAVDREGHFVVVWTSYGSYGSDNAGASVQGQRYDAAGNIAGDQFQVNTYSTSHQHYPSVAVDTDGDFVVVWTSYRSYGSDNKGRSIQGQRYDPAGNPVGDEFQINTYTTSHQWAPSVAVDTLGNFVAVWTSYGSFGSDRRGRSVQGQRYDAAGNLVGGQFQVNSYTTSHQWDPSVAVDGGGGFVVVWQSRGSYGTDTSEWSIQGQRYDVAGNPVGDEFQVNTYMSSHQQYPSVAVDGGGGFVVVWQSRGSYGTDTSDWSIQGQRYDAAGNPVGGEFQVNTYTSYIQYRPSVAVDGGGDFVVVWSSVGSHSSDNSSSSIQGRRYDVAGNPVGDEFQVNTFTPLAQLRPTVATDTQGNFIVAWTSSGSYGTDQSYWSIQGQRYTTPVFADDFESGDTSAWSSTVQ